jgi:hypothetical protein
VIVACIVLCEACGLEVVTLLGGLQGFDRFCGRSSRARSVLPKRAREMFSNGFCDVVCLKVTEVLFRQSPRVVNLIFVIFVT